MSKLFSTLKHCHMTENTFDDYDSSSTEAKYFVFL